MSAPAFHAKPFLVDLAKRGVMISLTEEGDLRAINATDADKATLRQHKPAIVAHLSTGEVI
jgi:hypothetical protein